MYKLIFGLTALCLSWSMAWGQADLTAPMPIDPAVRMGVLENGMTYYIRHNEEPKERASFYIIQNVGAILEKDEQNGLAHFLEHMSFNGTEHFHGKGIINTLERHGVAFGRNINAYTSLEETVYNLSNVPVGPEGLMDTCLLVLNDWSNYLLLTEEEIDAERGVISEEWRTRRDAGFRMRALMAPSLYNHSKYAKRDVIGDLEVIKNFDYQTLRDFYHDWYRTDLQAIAMVGDFDVDEMEQKVKTMFSKIPAVKKPLERYAVEIPAHKEPLYVLATDEEATQSSVAIYIKSEATPATEKNHVYYREGLLKSLYASMIRTRVSELLQKGNPPFINASAGFSGLTRGTDIFYVSATAKTNEEELAMTGILTEVLRAKRFGFTQGELERAKTNMLVGYENALKRRDKTSHDAFCSEFKKYYLDGEPMPGIDYEYEFATQIIPQITLEELSALAAATMNDENRVVIINGPRKEGVMHLSESEAFAIIEKLENDNSIEAYVDEEVASSLVADELPEVKVVETRRLEDMNAVEWTFENQAKVVYRFANYNKEKVALNAYSKGGSSLFGDEDVPSASMATEFMGAYGVGEFDAINLNKVLTGKSASVNPSLNGLSEGFGGSCRTQDFETMMQLLYLQFEQPRFDEEAYNALLARYKAYIANQGENPKKIMQDSVTLIMADYHPRARLMNESFLNDMSFQRMKEIYLDRFQDASDFTFFIVGDVPEDEVKMMAAKYIGNMKSSNRGENWIDREVNIPEGETVKNIPLKMTEAKATVIIKYNDEMDYTPANRIAMSVMEGVLDLRYTESIREKEGGTYGVGVRASTSHYPKAEGAVSISFDCDPERAADLIPLVYVEIEKLMKEGPTQEDLDKVTKNILKGRAESKENNGYWMGVIYNYYKHGINSDLPENYETIVNNLTVKDVKKVAKKFFAKADKVQLTFEPAE